MQNQGTQDKEFQKLQDALLQRILSSKLPDEREQLLNMHRRLLRRRVKQVSVMEEHGQQRESL